MTNGINSLGQKSVGQLVEHYEDIIRANDKGTINATAIRNFSSSASSTGSSASSNSVSSSASLVRASAYISPNDPGYVHPEDLQREKDLTQSRNRRLELCEKYLLQLGTDRADCVEKQNVEILISSIRKKESWEDLLPEIYSKLGTISVKLNLMGGTERARGLDVHDVWVRMYVLYYDKQKIQKTNFDEQLEKMAHLIEKGLEYLEKVRIVCLDSFKIPNSVKFLVNSMYSLSAEYTPERIINEDNCILKFEGIKMQHLAGCDFYVHRFPWVKEFLLAENCFERPECPFSEANNPKGWLDDGLDSFLSMKTGSGQMQDMAVASPIQLPKSAVIHIKIPNPAAAPPIQPTFFSTMSFRQQSTLVPNSSGTTQTSSSDLTGGPSRRSRRKARAKAQAKHDHKPDLEKTQIHTNTVVRKNYDDVHNTINNDEEEGGSCFGVQGVGAGFDIKNDD